MADRSRGEEDEKDPSGFQAYLTDRTAFVGVGGADSKQIRPLASGQVQVTLCDRELFLIIKLSSGETERE